MYTYIYIYEMDKNKYSTEKKRVALRLYLYKQSHATMPTRSHVGTRVYWNESLSYYMLVDVFIIRIHSHVY